MTEKKTWYAMVISRSSVDGRKGNTIDVSAYMVEAESEEQVRAKLHEDASRFSYENSDGETVRWPILRIMSIDERNNVDSGDMLTGFTFEKDEIDDLF